eukprot:6193104-Pleurochrysis_carterae.AAC.3
MPHRPGTHPSLPGRPWSCEELEDSRVVRTAAAGELAFGQVTDRAASWQQTAVVCGPSPEAMDSLVHQSQHSAHCRHTQWLLHWPGAQSTMEGRPCSDSARERQRQSGSTPVQHPQRSPDRLANIAGTKLRQDERTNSNVAAPAERTAPWNGRGSIAASLWDRERSR